MKFPRRQFLHLVAATVALPAASRVAKAQTYPTRPITMIVPFAAGGAADVIARPVAERMRGRIGQPIIIENVGGADGSIGVGRAARARPDGYMLCVGTLGTHVQNSAFYSLSYDVLHGFRADYPTGLHSVRSFCTQRHPGGQPKGPGRLAKGAHRPGVGRYEFAQSAARCDFLSKANRDAICHCSIPCGRLCD
jgi:hypothetical protein